MKRNLKILSLALVAMFALSAVVASAASAIAFKTGAASTRLTSEAKTNQIFETPSATVSCEKVRINSVVSGTSNSQVTAENIVYEENCTVTEGTTVVPANIRMNGCDYLFTAAGQVHIKCPVNKQIEVKVTLGGLELTCLNIHEQTPTNENVDYTNEGTGTTMDVRVKSTVEGITYERVGACGKGEFNDAKYTGEVTVTGEDPTTGAHISVTVE